MTRALLYGRGGKRLQRPTSTCMSAAVEGNGSYGQNVKKNLYAVKPSTWTRHKRVMLNGHSPSTHPTALVWHTEGAGGGGVYLACVSMLLPVGHGCKREWYAEVAF